MQNTKLKKGDWMLVNKRIAIVGCTSSVYTIEEYVGRNLFVRRFIQKFSRQPVAFQYKGIKFEKWLCDYKLHEIRSQYTIRYVVELTIIPEYIKNAILL